VDRIHLEGFAPVTNAEVENEMTKEWNTLPATFCTLKLFVVALLTFLTLVKVYFLRSII
jgi:hypothetical protein